MQRNESFHAIGHATQDLWADGIHVNVRMEENQCLLVLIGATEDGHKELLAVEDGYRESSQSWRELLLSLKAQGLEKAPKLVAIPTKAPTWSEGRRPPVPSEDAHRFRRIPATVGA